MNEIIYPITISYFGETKVGKSHLAATLYPHVASYINFATFSSYFRSVEVKELKPGDAFRTCLKLSNSKDFDMSLYKFVSNVEELNKLLKELVSVADKSKKEPLKWVIFDDTTSWRALARDKFTKEKGKPPMQYDWTLINQTMKESLDVIDQYYNIVLIHETKAKYINNEETGEFTPAFFPTRDIASYKADLIFELYIDRSGEMPIRTARILGSGHFDECNHSTQTIITDPTMYKILKCGGIPKYLLPLEYQNKVDKVEL